jgi:FkbM family methyltransferase
MTNSLIANILDSIPTDIIGGSKLKEKLTTIMDCSGCKWTKLQNGMKMYVDVESPSERYLWLGCYPKKIHDFLYNNLRKGCVFVDCGANIGLWSLIALSFYKDKGGTVYSFEPNPKLVDRLEKQRDANKIQDIWKIFPNAVSDKAAALDLIITEVHEKNYIEAKKKYFPVNKVNIESVKLDDISFDRAISGIKIDVEGHEPQVIIGAINTIKEHKPWVMLEINSSYTDSDYLKDCDIHHFMCDLGYYADFPIDQKISSGCQDVLYQYK